MTGLGDRILGLGLLVLAVAYGWVAQQWPEPFGGAEAVGPETFPTILSVVLVVGSLYLMVRHRFHPGDCRFICDFGAVVLRRAAHG